MDPVRYWIHDRSDTPSGLPLAKLVAVLRSEYPTAEACEISAARGYGLQVCAWDAATDTLDHVVVKLATLEQLLREKQEWFYDLQAVIRAVPIAFGLHDSSALFVEGQDSKLLRVVRHFDCWPAAR